MKIKNAILNWITDGILEALSKGKPNIRSRMAWMVAQRRFNQMADELEQSKKWWQSRTLIVNALTVIAGGLSFLASPDAKMDAQTVGTIGSILGIVNMALRFVTGKPIGK